MSSKVTAAARRAFVELATPLLTPEGADRFGTEAAATQWRELLARPLPKAVKYAKALQRITGTLPSLLHGIEYQDAGILTDEEFSRVVKGPVDKDVWRALGALTRTMLCATGEDMPQVPTREEIQANITAHRGDKAVRQQDTAAACAFKTSLTALGEMADCAPLVARAAAGVERDLCTAWARMTEANDFEQSCVRREVPAASSWGALEESERERVLDALRQPEAEAAPVWAQIDQLNTYGKLTSQVPSGVMNKIESMASRLASGLQTGAMTMDSVNLQQLGEDVLSGCSSEDLASLSNNLASILPTLQGMAPEMVGGMNIPGLAELGGPR